MFKQVIVSFAILLAIEVNSTPVKNIDLYAFIDQAKEELAELRQLVEGAILAAGVDLANLDSDFATFATDTASEGETAVQLESVTIQGQVETIENLAQSAGLDIVYINDCVKDRVETLNDLLAVVIDELSDCSKEPLKEASGITTDSTYIVDVSIGKVNDFDWQLHLCTIPSVLCISPIVTQIEQQMIELPEKISNEVNKASNLLQSLRVSIQRCSDEKVSEYSSQGYSVLGNIADCLDSYLGA